MLFCSIQVYNETMQLGELMAMCTSCQCYVLSDTELPEKQDDEEAMLSEAFYVKGNSRLGCQIQMNPEMDGLQVELAPES